MTNAAPQVRAAFRGMKAEGGWGVVCTGACSVDPSSDDSPFPCATLWDDADIRVHALMTEAVHAHGALAAVELWHGGAAAMNRTTRAAPLSPSGVPWMATHVRLHVGPARPKVMDAADIRDLIRWHAEAAVRAERAGFDILYVYAGMGYLPYQFLLSDYNHRTDAYGGSVAQPGAAGRRADRRGARGDAWPLRRGAAHVDAGTARRGRPRSRQPRRTR